MEKVYEPVPSRPGYGKAFACIGPQCEDHCCREWEIPLDRQTYEAYRQFSAEPLGQVVSDFIVLNPPGSPPGLFARIERRSTGACAFLGPDQLCGIQKAHGPMLLSATCSIYPRSLSQVAGALEVTLSLSCPEAARNVLLDPAMIGRAGATSTASFRTDNFYLLQPTEPDARYKPYRWFAPVRALTIDLLRDRARPVWQRLFLIGVLCTRLEEVTAASESHAMPAILAELQQIIAFSLHLGELNAMAGQPSLRLDLVAALLAERALEEESGSRFLTVWRVFEISLAAGLDNFLHAESTVYRPWMERNPHVLENYLLNYVLQHLFPFGREGSLHSAPMGIWEEFLLLAANFASIEVLLTGLAARHGTAFDAAHIVTGIQTYTRAVEHYPLVRRAMVDAIKKRGLASLEGLAILLRAAEI